MPDQTEFIEMPSEKAYYLQRIEVLREIEDEVVAWAKKRFWIASLVVAVLALVGGSTLISNLVASRVDEKVQAEISRYEGRLEKLAETTTLASAATSDAQQTAESAESLLLELDEAAQEFENKFSELNSRAQSLREELSSRSTANLSVVEEIRGEVERLTVIIEELASDDDARDQLSVVRKSLDDTAVAISKEKQEAGLARFEIHINSFATGQSVADQLKQDGLSTFFRGGDQFISGQTEYRGIYVGTDVPMDIVRKVIRVGLEQIPELDIILLGDSGLRHNSITLGYKIDDAITELLTDAEFEHILSAETREQFNTRVRELTPLLNPAAP